MIEILQPGFRTGAVHIPASKSQAHRLLICAALSQNETVIRCRGISRDIAATADCLNALGAEIWLRGEDLTVRPITQKPQGTRHLHCQESGSTLRFLLPLTGVLEADAVFHMEGRLPQRPLHPLDQVLTDHGMTIRQNHDLLYCGGRLRPGEFSLPGDVSSQYISGLLMALPLLNEGSALHTPDLLEVHCPQSVSLDRFPVDQNQARVTTAAYQAERDLDRLMYQDTGLYRNQQYAKASTVLLQTMYEEIPILWDQEMKYRPSFSAAGDTVTLPVICQKICGVKDGNASQYWLDIKKLITPDTEVIRSVPWVQGTDPNPVKPYATQFLKNGKLLRGKIKSHSAYLYGILRAEMQEHLLDKLQLLLDQKLIRGTFENGTEYTVIATALNLPKDLLRKIQKFDFTKKNPKLIYINPTEERISLEDSILAAFLSLVGFDVLFFVPTGYQCIEQHFTRPFASETQIGDYLYDLRIPDFNTVQESGLHSIRKLFGRSI